MVNESMNCKGIAQEQLLPQQVTVMALLALVLPGFVLFGKF